MAGRQAPGEDLFGAALQGRLSRQAPLAARMRPRSLDEVVGTGKTTIARLGATAKSFETLLAVTAGVKDVREVVEWARRRLGEQGQGTILFLEFPSHLPRVRHVRGAGLEGLWDTPFRALRTPHLLR